MLTAGRSARARPAATRPLPWGRLVLLAFGPVAMIAGLLGGLSRLGWDLPGGLAVADLHGPLMISGLFGTVISLERAVAVDSTWAYGAPGLSALGTAALLAGLPVLGVTSYLVAAAFLAVTSAAITYRQPALFNATLLLGAMAWLVGNGLWLSGTAIPDLIGWWLAFLVLTIAGERLELSRLLAPRRGRVPLFLAAVTPILAGAAVGLRHPAGAVLFGAGLLAVTAWMLRHDIARRNIRARGPQRFFAACMLCGYIWLGLAGVFALLTRTGNGAFGYDLVLHAILIGFVLSMVFGHALIILPAVTRLRLEYSPLLYGPLLLLHASLAVRVTGSLGEWTLVRAWSGVLTVLAILSFAAVVARSAVVARPSN